MCCDLFHSAGEVTAKPHLLMAFFGQTEERDSQFPRERLLVLIKEDKCVDWDILIVLNVIKLYLIKMWCEMGRQCSI